MSSMSFTNLAALAGAPAAPANDGKLLCRVSVPKRNLTKTVRLNLDDTVWTIKLYIIGTLNLNADTDDPLNFGVYLPHAGKYLDEQSTLGRFGFPENVAFEFKPKQRDTKEPEKTVKAMNTKKHQKQFYELQTKRDYEKLRAMLNKSFDPNFHYDQNETPLSYAVSLDDSQGISLLYLEGGAFLDFRTSDSKSPLHRAASRGNVSAVTTLLRLGASPHVRDKANLTPLADACSAAKSGCVQVLLQSGSPIGVVDSTLRTELHLACMQGAVQIAELLLEYGANINAVNEAGNTPLHICASKGFANCANLLLRRGCDPHLQNRSGDTPYQVALVFQNKDLADMINAFRPEDIVVRSLNNSATVLYEDNGSAPSYVPPPPPADATGIFAAPSEAPKRRKVYSTMPPPPPPSSADGSDTGGVGGLGVDEAYAQQYASNGPATDESGHTLPPPILDSWNSATLPPPPSASELASLGVVSFS